MSVCLTRLALLTRYDKLPSMLTPSLGYLWLINWTEKGPCRPSRGTLQCSSSGPSSKRRTKEGIGGGSTLKCLLLGWRHSSPKISRCVKKQNKTLGSTGEPVWGWWAVHLPPSLCCCLVPSREACAQSSVRDHHWCFRLALKVSTARWRPSEDPDTADTALGHSWTCCGALGGHSISSLSFEFFPCEVWVSDWMISESLF